MISEHLYNRLVALPKTAILNIMLAALDEMQHYNGRSHTRAIMEALGAEKVDDDRWKLPPNSELKKQWKDNYPIM